MKISVTDQDVPQTELFKIVDKHSGDHICCLFIVSKAHMPLNWMRGGERKHRFRS